MLLVKITERGNFLWNRSIVVLAPVAEEFQRPEPYFKSGRTNT